MKNEILRNIRDYWQAHTYPQPFVPGKTTVPVSGASINEYDIHYVADATLEGWFTEGRYANLFSKGLAKYIGVKHAILCNSGSSASLLALLACFEKYKAKGGNKVVTTALSFPTTVTPIVQNHFTPLFVDAHISTLNPDIEDVITCIKRPDVLGAIITHTLGFPVPQIDKLRMMCDIYGKFLIEDTCDGLGGTYQEARKLGSYGHCSTFSFFPAHQITTGEGGAVLTDNDELAELLRCYCEWGRDCRCKPGQDNTCGKRFEQDYPNMPKGYDHKYTFARFGYNLKITELQAALGYSQIQRVDMFKKARQDNYKTLWDALSPLSEYGLGFVPPAEDASPFGFPITVINPLYNKQEFILFLEKRKIRTRPMFAGNITRQPMFTGVPYEVYNNLKETDFIMENTFWLGVCPGINTSMLDWVIESVWEYINGKNQNGS